MSAYCHVNDTALSVGITTWGAGFAIVAMVLAPLSELRGRKPVFIVSGIIFVISQLCCVITRSYSGMLIARFFVGVGASTFSAMVGGVLDDIYHAQDRNAPMAFFSSGVFIGTGLGPMISGINAQVLQL